ncbi:MAG: hypothetical protein WBV85_09020 [Solirubrobacteraceae bacterium]
MTEFLQSIKTDLLSRRLWPFVALLGVVLLAAVGYVVKGGSSASAPAPVASAPSAPVTSTSVLGVTVASANPDEAVSETPGGVRYQSQGPTRDPFVPLPTPPAAKSADAGGASAGSSGSSGSGSSSTGGSSSGSSGSGSGGGAQKAPTPTPAPTPKKPTKPQLAYDVSVLFGPASTTPGQPAALAPYQSLKLGQPFPSKEDVRITFERVTENGSGAVFKLIVPPILHGTGTCLPSNSECQTIDLEAGHAEELEYVEADGQIVVYELKIVSIAKKGSAGAARAAHRAKVARVAAQARTARVRNKKAHAALLKRG